MLIKDLSTHRQYIFVSVAISLLLTLLSLAFHLDHAVGVVGSGEEAISAWHIGKVAGSALNFALLLAVGWGIFKANETFAISRHRSNLPYIFYLLLAFTNPTAQSFTSATLVAAAFIVAIVLLFYAYQRQPASEQSFWVGIIMGLLSLFWSKGLLYVPLFIFGLWFMRSLTGRSVIAMILGLLTPFWLQFAFLFFMGSPIPTGYVADALTGFDIADILRLGLAQQLNLLLTLLTAVFASGYILAYNLHEKVRTQAYLSFVVLLAFASGIFSLLDTANLAGHLAVLTISTAIAAANVFIRMAQKPATILFVLLVVSYVSTFIYSLWSF